MFEQKAAYAAFCFLVDSRASAREQACTATDKPSHKKTPLKSAAFLQPTEASLLFDITHGGGVEAAVHVHDFTADA